FFFQAEDGIRDLIVTGVQTCALPISRRRRRTPMFEAANIGVRLLRLAGGGGPAGADGPDRFVGDDGFLGLLFRQAGEAAADVGRSEERRVGKGGRAGGWRRGGRG